MKQLMVDGRAGPCVQEVDIPKISDRQILVKNVHSLVSTGTERHYLEQCECSGKKLRLGYCGFGEVAAVGHLVDHVSVGQRVIAMGWGHAVHAEYLVMPMRLVQPVPLGMPSERALFAGIMATAIHAVDRANLLAGDRVLVIGAGLVGQLVAEVARQTASAVLLTDLNHEKTQLNPNLKGVSCDEILNNALRYRGAFTKAFICLSGKADEWLVALPSLLNPQGNGLHRPRIIGVGRYHAQVHFSVELGNLDIVFSARCGEGYRNDAYVHGLINLQPLAGEYTVDQNLKRSLDLLHYSDVCIEPLISHRLTLNQLPDFYQSLKQPNAILSAVVNYS